MHCTETTCEYCKYGGDVEIELCHLLIATSTNTIQNHNARFVKSANCSFNVILKHLTANQPQTRCCDSKAIVCKAHYTVQAQWSLYVPHSGLYM